MKPDQKTQNYCNRIRNLREELTTDVVEYLKRLSQNSIIIPDQDTYEDGTWVMWVDDDGEAHDGRVTKISLYDQTEFSIEVEDKWGDRTTLFSGNDIGCDHIEWLESLRFMLSVFIDGDGWRYCPQTGTVTSLDPN